MAAGHANGTMRGMSTPIVIEAPLKLEPVTADPFVDDLDLGHDGALAAAFVERLAASPRRRIHRLIPVGTPTPVP